MTVSRVPELHIYANGQELKQVDQFKYIRVTYDSSATKETAVYERINQYNKNFDLLYPLLKDRYVPTAVKVTIYKTILRPIVTYGSESWTLTTATKSKIQAAETRVLRLIKGVTRRDRLRNEDIRKELDVKSILQHVEETQLRWFGHVKRISDDRTAHQWLEWKPSTTRPPGRPRKRWMDNIKAAMETRNDVAGGGEFRDVSGQEELERLLR